MCREIFNRTNINTKIQESIVRSVILWGINYSLIDQQGDRLTPTINRIPLFHRKN